MFNVDDFDALLHKAAKDNKDLFMQYGPDFSKIESRALNACKKKSRKSKSTLILRVAAACIGAVLLINVFLLFIDVGPVEAYQHQVKMFVFNLLSSKTTDKVEDQFYKESDEIQKLQRLVPYKIPVPTWLPSGYSFNDAQMRDDGNHIYTVILKYVSGSDSLTVNVSNISSMSNTQPSADEGGYEQVKVNGNEVFIAIINVDNTIRSKCFFYNNQGLRVYISGSVDKQSLIDIIGSMN